MPTTACRRVAIPSCSSGRVTTLFSVTAGSTMGLNVEAALRPPQPAPKSQKRKRHCRLSGLSSRCGGVGRCKLKASQNAAWLNSRTVAGRACVHAETCPTPIYGRAGRAAAPARLQYPTSRLEPPGGSGAESGYQDAQQACAGTACHYLVGASVASAAVASASAGSTYALTAPALAMSSIASAETA